MTEWEFTDGKLLPSLLVEENESGIGGKKKRHWLLYRRDNTLFIINEWMRVYELAWSVKVVEKLREMVVGNPLLETPFCSHSHEQKYLPYSKNACSVQMLR